MSPSWGRGMQSRQPGRGSCSTNTALTFLHNSVEDNLCGWERRAKPTYIMTRSHQNKLFPFRHHLSSQLFHYCPAISFCQHKKNTKCAWYPHEGIPSGAFMAVNVPSRSPHFLLLGARMPAPGNPVPAVGAYPGGGRGKRR